MSLDVGTIAGLLGVILTVVFFVIGYRQTIGARKERAAAADREVSEILLRRFTLEQDFSITHEEIERFVCGKAIENKVKRADLLSTEELFVVVYSRVVSSDYISSEQRRPILEKLNKCFKLQEREEGKLIEFKLSAQQDSIDVRKRDEKQFALLGVTSTLMAAVLTVVGTNIFATNWDGITTPLRAPLIIATALSVVTAASLALVYWLREKTATTRQDNPVSNGRARDFERRFVERLQAAGLTPIASNESEADLTLKLRDRTVAVELKLYPPNHRVASALSRRITDALPRLGCDEGYVVIGTPVPDKIRSASTERVVFVSADEFFRKFITSEKSFSIV